MAPGLACGSALFLAAFFVHWVHWRLRGVPGAPALAQSIHFLAFLAAYLAIRRHDQPRLDLAATALLYAALACAYIQLFPLAVLRSPTMELLLEIGRAGEQGVSREQLTARFSARSLFDERVEELLRSGMVVLGEGGRLEARWRGTLAVPVFLALRRILGLPAMGA